LVYKTTVLSGENMKLKIKEVSARELVDELVALEKEHGRSTLEIFQEYLEGKLDDVHGDWLEEWIDLYLLYLGTYEIRQYSCP
jgi:hypothetical protein